MSKKVPKTIYFTEEMARMIDERAKIMDRTVSAEVERLIKKALKNEERSDLEAIKAE